MIFDSQHDRYLVSNWNTGDIVAIDMEGNQTRFVSAQGARAGLWIVEDIVYCGGRSFVRGWNLATGERVFHLPIVGATGLNDVSADDRGNLYVGDVDGSEIYRVDIASGTYSTFVETISEPNGIWFDGARNRLLVCTTTADSPIYAVDLADSSVSIVTPTSLDDCDGICLDQWGRCYVSAWGSRSVYRFDPSFGDPPEMIYSNDGGPADLNMGATEEILAIPLLFANTYELLSVSPPVIIPDGDSDTGPIERSFFLEPNQPNPFKVMTELPFFLSEQDHVSLTIHDSAGRIIRTLIDERVSAGRWIASWSGNESADLDAPPGVYFARLKVGDRARTEKITLIH